MTNVHESDAISKVSVVGIGKLGACVAAAFASRGFKVVGTDISIEVVRSINDGVTSLNEPSLANLLQQHRDNMSATLSVIDAVLETNATFVVVPTPSELNGSFSLSAANIAFAEIGEALKSKVSYHVVVLNSTVLPGSMRNSLIKTLERFSGKVCGKDFGVCYNPAFIALGSIIENFYNPDFVLLGESDQRSGDAIAVMLEKVVAANTPIRRMSIENAELTKIALNTFVTTKIAFANSLTEMCERIPGGDIDVVSAALGNDQRIGRQYLTGGIGFGGPCFPRDNKALVHFAQSLGLNADIAVATDIANNRIPESTLRRFDLPEASQSRVAVLGLAYKPGTDYPGDSQGVELANIWAAAGASVSAFDALAGENARGFVVPSVHIANSIQLALADADIVFVTLPDQQFQNLSVADFEICADGACIVDFWRIYRNTFKNVGHRRYIPVGCGLDDGGWSGS